ncbi:methyltransferase [Streptomyces sp. SAJ15]|uniref:methyltransferase n=1 Tax=Streptomyces sp. SAJ15 TaxID=2011095 RepID=UPI001186ED36|nr:methyltransferase [Streptomyces sp. SAJ15]TVL91906.1 methyltransferase [Streptomyces sp. SAJ15]
MTDGAAASRRLMDLMIGYWASQAVYTAAKLGLADELADGPATPAQLADRTGTHEPSLARLLRFLAELGVVERDPARGTYRTTEVGRTLRTEEQGSMRDLALLYGEEFYAGWGHLTHTVRTGENAFTALHGAAMYPYFGRTPELTAKFDRAMAASSAFFDPIPTLFDFSEARTVVDIAGGNGSLLTTVLRAHPHLRGVLFDTEHVVDAARTELARTELAGRLDYAWGDYYEKVPAGGDVYLLSRVLHGRDDERCLEVLRRIREVIPEDGALLIVERVVPEDGSPSLAAWFDVHMLAIAGGSERTASEYAALLEQSGFALSVVHGLPLDTELLVAVPRTRSANA